MNRWTQSGGESGVRRVTSDPTTAGVSAELRLQKDEVRKCPALYQSFHFIEERLGLRCAAQHRQDRRLGRGGHPLVGGLEARRFVVRRERLREAPGCSQRSPRVGSSHSWRMCTKVRARDGTDFFRSPTSMLCGCWPNVPPATPLPAPARCPPGCPSRRSRRSGGAPTGVSGRHRYCQREDPTDFHEL